MDAVITAIVTAVLTGSGGYFWGIRRRKHERLDDRRASVLSRLGRLMYEVQRTFLDMAHSSDTEADGKVEEASRAFFELVHTFYRNEMWLESETCLKIEDFTNFAYRNLGEYQDQRAQRQYDLASERIELSRRITRELQPLRREVIDEFRAIVYPPPWYEAPLRLLESAQMQTREAQNSPEVRR